MKFFTKIGTIYSGLLSKHSLVVQSVQTGILIGTGDIIAQMTVEKKNFSEINTLRTAQFLIMGTMLVGPARATCYKFMSKTNCKFGKSAALKKMAVEQLLLAPTFLVVFITAPNTLQGPPSFITQNGTYQLRNFFTDIAPYKDTRFELYTRSNPEEPHILRLDDDNLLQNSPIDFGKATIIFFHGFLESTQSDVAVQIRKHYLQRGDYNVILVDNERLLAGPFYFSAARNCEPIGKYSAKFLDYLVGKGLKLSMLHIIGMSLGGQIAGYTGRHLESGKAYRVTGLDPAGPYFNTLPASQRINKNDGEFVDIIHTNAGIFGIKYPCGHVDIWVNGGTLQPGCSPIDIVKRNRATAAEFVFCSHYQAYRVYVQSLINSTEYEARKCSNHVLYRAGACDRNAMTYIGVDIDRTARGDYYVDTGATAVNI